MAIPAGSEPPAIGIDISAVSLVTSVQLEDLPVKLKRSAPLSDSIDNNLAAVELHSLAIVRNGMRLDTIPIAE
jgi:hypothetical protein